jgi:hypothetical protein
MLLAFVDLGPVFWQYAGIFFAALSAILLGLLLWRRRELRRYRAMEVADEMAQWGLARLAKLLRAYAVGNYFGADSVTRVTHQLIDDIQSEGLGNLLRNVGWKVVENVFVKDPEDRKKLAKLLETGGTGQEVKKTE